MQSTIFFRFVALLCYYHAKILQKFNFTAKHTRIPIYSYINTKYNS